MKKSIFTVTENIPLNKNVYKMTLCGDVSEITSSGQFVNIQLDGFFLRRPISVCDYSDGTLTLIYKVVGGGTEHMSKLKSGAELDILTGLGNGYDTSLSGEKPLLLGGGVGNLEDIYDALSGGTARGSHKVRYGHGSSYYSDTDNRRAETLANYGALSVLRPDLIELLAEDKPELVEALGECVAEMLLLVR